MAMVLRRMFFVAVLTGHDWVWAKEMFCEITGPCKSVGPSHTMHLRVDGSAFGIGRNNFGQLGDGTRQHATAPVMASTMSPVAYVSVGGWHSLFLRRNGEAVAVGKNDVGQLGDGTQMTRTLPGKIKFSGGMMWKDDVIAISAGYQHSLFLKKDGSAWASGGNECGQLGNGNYGFMTTPELILYNVTAISAGESHSLFVKNDGSVFSAGCNQFGQLGDMSTMMRVSPSQADISDVERVIAGQHKSLFIKTDGTVWATGQVDDNLGYTAGPDWPRSTPVQVATKLDDIITPEGEASLEQAILGQAVYATDQRFALDDPFYAQNTIPAMTGIGFDNWNYR